MRPADWQGAGLANSHTHSINAVDALGDVCEHIGVSHCHRSPKALRSSQKTLGDVLYRKSGAIVPEKDWVVLVQSIAAGDQLALHALYERSHRLVFTLALRILGNREAAEDCTVDVFGKVWTSAQHYDASQGPVLGWIMNLARSRSVSHPLAGNQEKRKAGTRPLYKAAPAGELKRSVERKQPPDKLRDALTLLTADERKAIELTFFAGLTDTQVADRMLQPPGIIKKLIRSGLHKLKQAAKGPDIGLSEFAEISCEHSETTYAYALRALPENEANSAVAHIASCSECRKEIGGLYEVVETFTCWPTDILSPVGPLRVRVALDIAKNSGKPGVLPPAPKWPEPEWEQVAPGIECKLLATDARKKRVSMLVRLAPGGSYPSHTHADVEELHLLDGELWIDKRKLSAGDYNYGAPGATDVRVESKTGCTCVLVTSTRDILG